MRLSRQLTLPGSGFFVHKIWRFHNCSFGLEGEDIRELFLKCVTYALNHRSVAGRVRVSAFCVMTNHAHQLIYTDGNSTWLSKFMQISLTRFARIYNDLKERSGAVGNGRAKTIEIQKSDSALMRAHMYIEANPVRARISEFENLKLYKGSSFRFYAFGDVDKLTRNLEIPEWYLLLGETPAARQAAYRSIFKAFLEESRTGKALYEEMELGHFFGELIWVQEKLREVRNSIILARNRTVGLFGSGPPDLHLVQLSP